MQKNPIVSNLISINDLKTWLQRDLTPRDKLLLVLASFDSPCQVKDIKAKALEAGFSIPKVWNISSVLKRSKGLAIKIPDGWEITESGLQQLTSIGVFIANPSVAHVATDLRNMLPSIKDENTRAFAEEAIKCHELGLYRSAIVMSWLAAVGVLYEHVHQNCLSKFNAEAKRVNGKWKDATTTDDLSKMKEVDFLDRIENISVIGKDVKNQLQECLKKRNSCGHPNSLQIRANTSAAHMEILLLNVFSKF